MSTAAYSIIFSGETLNKILDYKRSLENGTATPGARLAFRPGMDTVAFIEALLATKLPRIFAESEIKGDGSDWTMTELSILGDINVAMPVRAFDNGAWSPDSDAFARHTPPLPATLLFTPGALLQPNVPDLAEVTTNGLIDQEKYNKLIERRLLPLLAHANAQAAPAIVTLPGISCGAFAGAFKGTVARHLDIAMQTMLQKYAVQLPHIKMIYFDPFGEGSSFEKTFAGIRYISQPKGLPQLSAPADFGYPGHALYKVVAWDHASWPGNDFFAGARFTDDGVSAAATDSMMRVTGLEGLYRKDAYLPPADCETWEAATKGKTLSAAHSFVVPTGGTTCEPLRDIRKPAAKPPAP